MNDTRVSCYWSVAKPARSRDKGEAGFTISPETHVYTLAAYGLKVTRPADTLHRRLRRASRNNVLRQWILYLIPPIGSWFLPHDYVGGGFTAFGSIVTSGGGGPTLVPIALNPNSCKRGFSVRLRSESFPMFFAAVIIMVRTSNIPTSLAEEN
ncbi:hypothetical protein KEM48_003641 [Puccinia striiformis f. sp. tritici PST-130]|nr:hypothetical protein KEM48_003641 [Puccinia striiformis f. sp. tritici PST-130]